LNITV